MAGPQWQIHNLAHGYHRRPKTSLSCHDLAYTRLYSRPRRSLPPRPIGERSLSHCRRGLCRPPRLWLWLRERDGGERRCRCRLRPCGLGLLLRERLRPRPRCSQLRERFRLSIRPPPSQPSQPRPPSLQPAPCPSQLTDGTAAVPVGGLLPPTLGCCGAKGGNGGCSCGCGGSGGAGRALHSTGGGAWCGGAACNEPCKWDGGPPNGRGCG